MLSDLGLSLAILLAFANGAVNGIGLGKMLGADPVWQEKVDLSFSFLSLAAFFCSPQGFVVLQWIVEHLPVSIVLIYVLVAAYMLVVLVGWVVGYLARVIYTQGSGERSLTIA